MNILLYIVYYIYIFIIFYKKKKLLVVLLIIILSIHYFIPYFDSNTFIEMIDQTTPNMIQRISRIFERNPLISKEI